MAVCRKQDDEYLHAACRNRDERRVVSDAQKDQSRSSQAVHPFPHRVGQYQQREGSHMRARGPSTAFSAAFVRSGDAQNTHSSPFHLYRANCLARDGLIPLGLCLSSGRSGDISAFHLGQAVNRDRKPYKGGAVEHEIDADRQTNEKSAGCRPSGEKEDAEDDRD